MIADELVALLGLLPHPEGGFYRETFRSSRSVGDRSASTAIWFLLPAGAFSAWHRVTSDEAWHHYDGDPLELWQLGPDGLSVTRLGRDWAAGERPQAVVPAGVWQAARPVGDRFALCGCTVAPGFDFADFTLADGPSLAAAFPDHLQAVRRFLPGATGAPDV